MSVTQTRNVHDTYIYERCIRRKWKAILKTVTVFYVNCLLKVSMSIMEKLDPNFTVTVLIAKPMSF